MQTLTIAHTKAEAEYILGTDLSSTNSAIGPRSKKQLQGSASAWLSTLVQEMSDSTKREYEVLNHRCGVYSEPHMHQGRFLGSRVLGDRVSACQITVNGWLKLDREEGWMATDVRCLNEDEEKEGELMRLVIPPGDAVQELVVSEFHSQGICCLEVVFQQVAFRKLPHCQALPLGVCRRGELVFALGQNFDGWVRLVSPEGWMLVHAEEHGDLLRPRLPDDVADVDVSALCEMWMMVRRTHLQPLLEETVDGLKDLERRASRAAADMAADTVYEFDVSSPSTGHPPEMENQHSFNKRRRCFFAKAVFAYLRQERPFGSLWQETIEYHGRQCAISHDNVVYEGSTGEAIGVWDEDSAQVVEAPVLNVDGRLCLVVQDCAVYDLGTREFVGVFNHETHTVEALDEYEAETMDEKGESSDLFNASISEEIDAGTGGMPMWREDISTDSLENGQTGNDVVMAPARRVIRDASSRERNATISSRLHVTQNALDQVVPRVSVEQPPRTENLSFQLPSVEAALKFAKECDAAEKTIYSPETVWDEVVKLGRLLLWTAQSEFELPPHFHRATAVCTACWPDVLEGQLQCIGRIVELLEMPDLAQILRYFEQLELVICDLGTSTDSSSRTAPDPQHVQCALRSWPAACASLQQHAAALWEAIRCHAPGFLSNVRECADIRKARKGLQEQHAKVGKQMAEQMKAAAAGLAAEFQCNKGSEWTTLAEKAQATLKHVQQLTAGFLETDEASMVRSRCELQAFRRHAEACNAAVAEARQQVKRHFQAFKQTVVQFTELGEEIATWARVVVPKVRVLCDHSKALSELAVLQSRLHELEGEKISAEDELDMAVMELRRHRRRMRSMWANRSIKAPAKDVEVATMVESRLELNQRRLEGHVRQLEIALRAAQKNAHDAARELPMAVEVVGVTGGVWSLEGWPSIDGEERKAGGGGE